MTHAESSAPMWLQHFADVIMEATVALLSVTPSGDEEADECAGVDLRRIEGNICVLVHT